MVFLRDLSLAAIVMVAGCRDGAAGAAGGTDDATQGGTIGDDGDGADESAGDAADGGDDAPAAATSSWTTRRLSLVELGNTYQAILGVVPESLASAPPDSLGLTYDRLVNTQTISAAHLEALAAGARQAVAVLVQEKRLDDVVAECTGLAGLGRASQRSTAGVANGRATSWPRSGPRAEYEQRRALRSATGPDVG